MQRKVFATSELSPKAVRFEAGRQFWTPVSIRGLAMLQPTNRCRAAALLLIKDATPIISLSFELGSTVCWRLVAPCSPVVPCLPTLALLSPSKDPYQSGTPRTSLENKNPEPSGLR